MGSSDTGAQGPALLRLFEADNILVVVRRLETGDRIEVAGESRVLEAGIGFGHKVAARAIAAGEKIIKYNMPIGSATRDIAAGEHVHLHNMKSDYLPTFVRGEMKEGE